DDFFPESQRLVELFTGDPIAGLTAAGGGDVRGVCHGGLAAPRGGPAPAGGRGYAPRGASGRPHRRWLVAASPGREAEEGAGGGGGGGERKWRGGVGRGGGRGRACPGRGGRGGENPFI